MTEKGFPWDGIEGDIRSITGDQLAQAYATIIGNGVVDYENDFLLTVKDTVARSVIIKSGKAWIEGHLFAFNGQAQLTLPTGTAVSAEVYPGLIVLRCRPETNYRDFIFDVKYSTNGEEPKCDVNEIPLYRFRHSDSSNLLLEEDIERCVNPAVPKNMFLDVLRKKPDSSDLLQYSKPSNDGKHRIPGLFLYAKDISTDPYTELVLTGHKTYGWVSCFRFLNGLLLSDPSRSMMMSMLPDNLCFKLPNGCKPFESNASGDVYTAMRWQNDDGSKNTQVVCKQDSLMCYINGIGTELAAWTSDKKLKKNIKNSEISALDIVLKIKHKQFDWRHNGRHQNIGYVANELEKLNSEFVVEVPQEDGDVLLQINPHTIIPVLSKAIQEQHNLILDLQSQIKALSKKVEGEN